MEITRVVFEKHGSCKSLATCSVVLDDCLQLNNIRLYKNNKNKEYYLVLPSKQDVYQEVKNKNKGINLEVKKETGYEEFYHPVNPSFYKKLLVTVSECYSEFKTNKKFVFRF